MRSSNADDDEVGVTAYFVETTPVNWQMPGAAAGNVNGLPMVDANNRIAGIQGSIPTLEAYSTAAGWSVEAALTIASDTATIVACIDHHGLTVATPMSCTVTLKNSAGTTLSSGTDAAPDAAGVFAISIATPGLAANTTYYAVVAIVNAGTTYTKVIPFTTL